MDARELVPFIALLQRYYAGAFTKAGQDAWQELEVFAEEPLAQRTPALRDAVVRLSHPTQGDARSFPYDFNRLFVGPARLEAAPYETVYLSEGRSLMGHHTRAVRASYRRGGWEPAALNRQPDDHMALELAFLERTLEHDYEVAREFFDDHLSRWHAAHAEEIRAHSSNGICLAFADVLEATCTAWAA